MNIKKGKPGRKHQYEFAFKRKVVEELLSGQITAGDLSKKYAIPGAGTIMRWVKWYQDEQEQLSSVDMENPTTAEESGHQSTEIVKELERAKVKISALEIMIDIAEKEYGIEIRKKSGTKPSLE